MQIEKYSQACDDYKQYLEDEIAYQVKKITDASLIKDLYRKLIKSQFGHDATPDEDDFTKFNSYTKRKLYSAIINSYLNDPLMQKVIEDKLKNNVKLVLVLKKCKVINEAGCLLRDSKEKSLERKIDYFCRSIKGSKGLLQKRCDSGFATFIKGLGVVAGIIFGMGVGGYFAYKSFFGSQATRGRQFVDKLADLKKPLKRKK